LQGEAGENQEKSMVNKRIVTSVAFVVLLPVAGVACMSVFQSSFSSRFSIQELAQRNQSKNGLNCPGSGGGAGIGSGGGGGSSGQKESSFHKGESCSCQISDADQFDEAKFLQALKESVEKDLDANKAKITSSKNPEANSFSVEYTVGDTAGRVEISGTRSAGYYSLQAQLDEKTGG
jgi:hypothetical protein